MLTVAAFYHFTALPDPAALKPPLAALACARAVRGTILLASEGVNGTIAGPRTGVEAVLAHIRALPGCEAMEWKESHADEQPFKRLKVRLKKEIVTLGQPGTDPTSKVGTYVAAADWNDLIARDDVAVIDTRNDYEVDIGRFKGAIDPGTASFTEFPNWWQQNHDRLAGKTIAMYCTGGIRCEKASSWLLDQGVEEVFHLKGGVLKYLEETPPDNSLWDGECFVFDERVSLVHGLAEGSYDLCHACGHPVSEADRAAPAFEPGVQCPHCVGAYAEADRERFRQRQRQLTLARSRARVADGKQSAP
ncbi:MAG: rhodanese-related sulfurtransferase [Pseudomonadota bacterium]